jgi:hypothetical protein
VQPLKEQFLAKSGVEEQILISLTLGRQSEIILQEPWEIESIM